MTLWICELHDERTGTPLRWSRLSADSSRELELAAVALCVMRGQRFPSGDRGYLLLTPAQQSMAISQLGAIRQDPVVVNGAEVDPSDLLMIDPDAQEGSR